MPKRVFIVGLIFCPGGILGIFQGLNDMSQSRIRVPFAIVLLPIGLGLMRGKPAAQK